MVKLQSFIGITGALVVAYPSMTLAETITVTVNLTDTEGIGEKIGIVTLEDTEYGMLLTPNLVNYIRFDGQLSRRYGRSITDSLHQ